MSAIEALMRRPESTDGSVAGTTTLQMIEANGTSKLCAMRMRLLGTLSTQDLANAIALQDWASVEQSPGVGKKLAQRIVDGVLLIEIQFIQRVPTHVAGIAAGTERIEDHHILAHAPPPGRR